ncbi:hypothetical protein Poli38472_004232 [Pythium oligandrum]|uniref:Uncharacterized protein n=1 Tax=Pythium oligandrum TaxID=41045 RepID=A0A8K1FP22_PYTOL|nr:hypothetical protein Poli38472_004232 [Pythium oligandrum]|eukprot:TMW66467.1 hypothetical protein Poli38472_004232 [Pythium oligandrum]
MRWTLYDDPALALTTWQWAGCTQIKNSWGWVRCVHFVFAVDTIFNLCVLLLVIFRNYQRRKIWIGDAFVSISDSPLLRGLVILAIWLMENFWQLSSLALRDGSMLGASVNVFSFAQIMHGDPMSLYVSLAGLLGVALQERIDPALTILLFELGFRNRLTIAKWLPLTTKRVVGYAESDYLLGIAKIPVELEGFSPFGFWSTHHLVRNASAIGSCLFPVFVTFAIIGVYAVIRKVYRRKYPSRSMAYSSRLTKGSSLMSEGKGIKNPFTMFEMATGAELQNRVGIICDYDNCVYIKGLRYATADGIYCNGFVIANNQWLIRTGDLWSILLIIISGLRLRDVFVYEVKDHKVSQTARLVFPTTMTVHDLVRLNTTVLA